MSASANPFNKTNVTAISDSKKTITNSHLKTLLRNALVSSEVERLLVQFITLPKLDLSSIVKMAYANVDDFFHTLDKADVNYASVIVKMDRIRNHYLNKNKSIRFNMTHVLLLCDNKELVRQWIRKNINGLKDHLDETGGTPIHYLVAGKNQDALIKECHFPPDGISVVDYFGDDFLTFHTLTVSESSLNKKLNELKEFDDPKSILQFIIKIQAIQKNPKELDTKINDLLTESLSDDGSPAKLLLTHALNPEKINEKAFFNNDNNIGKYLFCIEERTSFSFWLHTLPNDPIPHVLAMFALLRTPYRNKPAGNTLQKMTKRYSQHPRFHLGDLLFYQSEIKKHDYAKLKKFVEGPKSREMLANELKAHCKKHIPLFIRTDDEKKMTAKLKQLIKTIDEDMIKSKLPRIEVFYRLIDQMMQPDVPALNNFLEWGAAIVQFFVDTLHMSIPLKREIKYLSDAELQELVGKLKTVSVDMNANAATAADTHPIAPADVKAPAMPLPSAPTLEDMAEDAATAGNANAAAAPQRNYDVPPNWAPEPPSSEPPKSTPPEQAPPPYGSQSPHVAQNLFSANAAYDRKAEPGSSATAEKEPQKKTIL